MLMSLNIIFPVGKRVFFFGNNPKIAKEETDFPEPDSPTIPSISFFFNE